MLRVVSLILTAAALLVPTAPAVADDKAGEIVVYSARKEHLVKPLFELYRQKTGIPVRYITDKAGPLLTRLKAEGSNTAADLLLTVDAGNLWQAAEQGLLLPLTSPVLEDNVPDHLQDPENRWFGLSVRARTIVYSTERVKPEELTTYEDLAGDKWKGRLCLRTSKKVYNQSLVAMLIARLGEEKTEEIVKGWVKNLAAPPFSNDTKAIQAVSAGLCDVTIVNTYYFGRLQKENPKLPLAVFWPNQQSSGVHVNVSGGGVTKHADQPEAAKALLEWLSQPQAQKLLAELNLEYPVNPEVAIADQVAAWGTFDADPLNIAKAGELQAKAVRLMDRAGYR